MKKNYLFLWRDMQIGKGLLAFFLCVFLIGVTSCNQGFDSKEVFTNGVTGVTLESPDPSGVKFTKLAGTTNVKIEWPVVMGAGGYTFSFYIVDDPDNPVLVGEADEFIDGCSAIREYEEETKYMALIKAVGNSKLDNKDAVEATQVAYDTFLPATLVPAGQDLAEYFKANLQYSPDEQGFELVAGETYTLNSIADLDLSTITIRGDKTNRPTIVLGEQGAFMTQAGLSLKFINFDCTDSRVIGFINLSDNPSETISTESLGYKAAGASEDGFVINGAILMQECNFRNVNNSLLYGNKISWSLRSFVILDCIVQLKNETSNSVIHLEGARNGLIQNITIKNNTFYNLLQNDKGYFIRYSNSSNAQPAKIFGTGDNQATHTIEYNTFSHVMSNKDFGNNMHNASVVTVNVRYNIFYDVFRLYQYIQTNTTRRTIGNTIFGVWGGEPNSNDTGGRSDSDGNPFATLEDPNFVGPFEQELDLTKVDGGLNFTPRGSIAVQNKSGDPRWYE